MNSPKNLKVTRLFAAALATFTFATVAHGLGAPVSSNAQIAGKQLQVAVSNTLPSSLQSDVASSSRSVRMDIDRLALDLKQLNANIANLPTQYRSALLDKVAGLKAGLIKDLTDSSRPAPSPTPAPLAGQYCVSSCKTMYSQPDPTTSIGARGSNVLIAQQAASDKLKGVYTCSYGQIAGECSAVGAKEDAVTCQMACTNMYGQADMGSSAVANGSNELEAAVNAQVALKAKLTCNYSIVKVKCITN